MDMLKAKSREYLKESGDIAIKTHVLLGDPADKIIEFANGENMDLIIMGNVGLRGISRIKALGSVSRRVSEMASCPILLVH
jgi:nucleotide-binding universal stress UspA family protein